MSMEECSTSELIDFVQGWIKEGDGGMRAEYEEGAWILCNRLDDPQAAETISETIRCGIFRSEPMLLALITVRLRDMKSRRIASVILTGIAENEKLTVPIRQEALRMLSERAPQIFLTVIRKLEQQKTLAA